MIITNVTFSNKLSSSNNVKRINFVEWLNNNNHPNLTTVDDVTKWCEYFKNFRPESFAYMRSRRCEIHANLLTFALLTLLLRPAKFIVMLSAAVTSCLVPQRMGDLLSARNPNVCPVGYWTTRTGQQQLKWKIYASNFAALCIKINR